MRTEIDNTTTLILLFIAGLAIGIIIGFDIGLLSRSPLSESF